MPLDELLEKTSGETVGSLRSAFQVAEVDIGNASMRIEDMLEMVDNKRPADSNDASVTLADIMYC